MSNNDTHDRLGISRRTALALVGGAAVLPSVSLRAAFAQTHQMIMATGGGKLEDAYRVSIYEPWKEMTGIEIVTTGNEPAKLKSMVEQGQMEWDVMQGAAELFSDFAAEGLFEPIDYSVVDKTVMLPGTAHEHFVLTDVAAYHIAWNTDNVTTEGPADWAALWALDGRIGLWKRPFQTLEAALLADGVAPGDLYPLDVERGLKSLEAIKDKLVWWEKGAQGAQLLLDGEVDAGAIWNGRVHEPRQTGAPVDFHFNQAVFVNDAWAVPKGAPNKDKAMEFVAFALSAQAQADFARAIPYGPVNNEAFALLDEETLKWLPSSEENFKKGFLLDLGYWSANGAAVSEQFNEWLLT
jgi:putative spermidine/putrescine transport system substrate-binding protein